MKRIVHPTGAMTVMVLASLLAAAGCKTDAVVNPTREAPPGPTADLENPTGVDLPPIRIVDRSEVDLVEEMMLHRAMYARYLRALVTYYSENGYEEKANWARRELNDLKYVKPYRYITDAEVPAATLRPSDSVSEADRLYEEGLALMKKGGHGVPALYNQQTMKLALAKFKELVDRFPNSDKIDDAAFMIAEIHKEYFEETDNSIAVQWYQRALDWNPNLPYPARFQMAVILDYRMHERDKALAMYQEVLEKETFNKSNVDFANVRIRQLTSEKTRHAPPDIVAGDVVPAGEPSPGTAAVASPPPPPGPTADR